MLARSNVRLTIPKHIAPRRRVLALVAACFVAEACAGHGASVRLSATPEPLPVALVMPCGGVFAGNPCSASIYLQAKLTVSVTNSGDTAGRGTLALQVIDNATGQPLPGPAGTVSGEVEVALEAGATRTVPLEWKRNVPDSDPGRIPPARLAFVITFQFTDSMGNRTLETVTLREALPRPWEIS